jgi:hypothetical protein
MLEREAQRNVGVMWLTGKLTLDFKTVANFRGHNRKAIQEVCRGFTSFCRDLDLFSRDLVAIDGSKFKAVNSRERNFTDRKLQRALQEIDRPVLPAPGLQAQVARTGSTMALRAKQALRVDRLEVLTDMGYYDGQQVKACLEANITPCIPKPNTSANTPLGLYGKEDFRYDPENDCYGCPAGEQLTFRFPWPAARAGKPQCTRSSEDRRITRWAYEDLLEDMQRRLRANRHKMMLRKQLVEHPFGTLKRAWNQGYFLTKGLESVNAEMSLTVLACNIKRAIKILGVPRMIEALA